MQAWGIAPGVQIAVFNKALKARFRSGGRFSIPNIPLVEIDAVPAQQFAIFLLKRASAMVLFLRLNVLQHRLELTRAHRKRTIPTLPEKAAIASVKCFDPLRGYLLDSLDESAWATVRGSVVSDNERDQQHRQRAQLQHDVTADCGQISVYARPHV